MHLTLRPYCRPFKTPLRTHHGPWESREGLILRLEDDQGRLGYGEIAPLPWFGTETLAQARAFCQGWPDSFDPAQIAAIPQQLPACQFGFAGALASLETDQSAGFTERLTPEQICALLPASDSALNAWQPLWHQGHRTFKWKIGVAAIAEELSAFQALIDALPADAQLRLDANGGLAPEEAERWLQACDRTPNKVEFLEQPLPPDIIVDWVLARGAEFTTAIALDESVATLQQLQAVHRRLQNRVVYVVKPAIAGFPEQLRAFGRQHQPALVFSSVLETPIGRRAALSLVQALWAAGLPQRALGFGVGHWFQDDWSSLTAERLWSRL